jgi:hypothetical protein
VTVEEIARKKEGNQEAGITKGFVGGKAGWRESGIKSA